MGHFRFRRSMKIAPGLKLNFNKNSTSLTFGGKGAHYTVNSKGSKTTTFGIPGTGLSYTDVKRPKKDKIEKSGTYFSPNLQEPNSYNDSHYYQQSTMNYSTQGYYNGDDNNNNIEKPPFFQRTWFIILMLIFVSPVGIFLMWYFKEWNKGIKIVISLFFIFYFTIYCGAFG